MPAGLRHTDGVAPTDISTELAASVDLLLERWHLEPDGAAFATATSVLAPARRDGAPVMVKIATHVEESRGNAVMLWWNGHGSARVLEHDADSVLLERAIGSRSLVAMAEAASAGVAANVSDCAADDEATRILCETGMRLHATAGIHRLASVPVPELPTLPEWFAELFTHAAEVGGFHGRAAVIAGELLKDQHEVTVLHGDLHHGNVLDFGAASHPESDGWAAIDPKGLIGDRAFDFANILCNPSADAALRPGRLARAVDVVAHTTGIDRLRLLRWAIAWCALSSAWDARSGQVAAPALSVGLDAERLLDAA